VARFNMGLVIATGISIGTLFTLFVVPAVYLMLGADHHKQLAAAEAETESALTDAPGQGEAQPHPAE
jgi:multidrug efflux pump